MFKHNSSTSRSRLVIRGITFVILAGFSLYTSGCNLPINFNISYDATAAALSVQATLLVQQQEAQPTAPGVDATQMALDVQSTVQAQQATQLAEQAVQQLAQPTPTVESALPSSTPEILASPAPEEETPEVEETAEETAEETPVGYEATQIAQAVQATLQAQQATQQAAQPTPQVVVNVPSDTPPAPTSTSLAAVTPASDLERQIKSAKILLFEDMSGRGEARYIKEALDAAGYSYTDVGSAVGWFKDRLISSEDWDLIISASEARTKVQGEFFVYLYDHIKKGEAVIIEIWDLDDLKSGKIAPLLLDCGIEVQSDWQNPSIRSIWWLIPEHPLFHEPNDGVSLRDYVRFWRGDVGDLIKLKPGGKATILGGTMADQKTGYATLATCFDGRVIFQTHSTHDYPPANIQRLWQNYVFYTLKNHFLVYP